MTDEGSGVRKSDHAFRTISEAADQLGLPQHVLRFWETKFPQLRPMKRAAGRRYYRPEDLALLERIRSLLHDEGYTIKGVQKLLREGPMSAAEPRETPVPAEEATPIPENAAAHADSPMANGTLSAEARREVESILAELKGIRALFDNPAA